MPKFTILHFERCSGVTSSGLTPKTRAAVSRCMSSPLANASIMAPSRLIAAMRRSSICE